MAISDLLAKLREKQHAASVQQTTMAIPIQPTMPNVVVSPVVSEAPEANWESEGGAVTAEKESASETRTEVYAQAPVTFESAQQVHTANKQQLNQSVSRLSQLLAAQREAKRAEAQANPTPKQPPATRLTAAIAAARQTALISPAALAAKAAAEREAAAKTAVELSRDSTVSAKPLAPWSLPKEIQLHPYLAQLLAPPAGLEADPSQDAAVLGLMQTTHGVLVGAAGTGKTTTVKRFIKAKQTTIGWIDRRDTVMQTYDAERIRARSHGTSQADQESSRVDNAIPGFCFLGYTGRSVAQLKKSLPKEYHPLCKTIHRALGFHPEMQEGAFGLPTRRFVPYFCAERPLPYKCIIVDEVFMVSVDLWNQLMDALTADCQVFVLGDIAQLPPPVGTSVGGFLMREWPLYVLDKIHRQAGDNPIISAATDIRNGRIPKAKEKGYKYLELKGTSSTEAFQQIVNTVKGLTMKGLYDPAQDAIIVGQNVGPLGVEAMNNQLVNFFNQPKYDEDGIRLNPRVRIACMTESVFYAVDDLVMNLKNDYELGVMNGMIGKIVAIANNPKFEIKGQTAVNMALGRDPMPEDWAPDSAEESDAHNLMSMEDLDRMMGEVKEEGGMMSRAASHVITVEFENGEEKLRADFATSGQIEQLRLAYAFTCHKTQGNEFRNVIVVCHSAQHRMLSREWLYTAVTRTKQSCLVICNNRGLSMAIARQEIPGATIEQKLEYFKSALARLEGAGREPVVPYYRTVSVAELNQVAERIA